MHLTAFINYVVPLNKSLFVIRDNFLFHFGLKMKDVIICYFTQIKIQNTQIKTLREKQCLVTFNNIITSLYHYFYQ